MADERRNVVLVTADSIRADHCDYVTEAEGDSAATALTPNVDALAENGVGFTTAVAPGPRTPSSVPPTMTSTPMPADRIDPTDWQRRLTRIREHVRRSRPLAARMSEAGYETVAYVGNPFTSPQTGFDDGFGTFHTLDDGPDLHVLSGTRFAPLTKYLDQWYNRTAFFSRWEEYGGDAIRTVRKTERPVFLWLFLLDTHNPYTAPRRDRVESSWPEMYWSQLRANSLFKDNEATAGSSHRETVPSRVERSVQRVYRDAVRSVDRCVGRLRDELDDAIVVFHSDHGEAFREHGTFGHQRRLYEENVRVPLAVGGVGEGTVSSVVSLRSLCEMVAAHVTEAVPFTADRWTTDAALLRTEDNGRYGLRTNRWKFVRGPARTELYDLRADPDERRNVVGDRPDVVAELGSRLDERIAALPERRGYDPADADVRDRLSELGYVE